MSRLTVVMATRNRRDRAVHACRDLLALPESPPVVVVDNGSTDGTAAALAALGPQVTVLAQPVNRGTAARTIGVRHARTPYVAFCDDDSGWTPGSLERAGDHLDAAPRLALLAARVLVGAQQRLDPVSAMMADSPLPAEADLPGPPVLGFLACGAIVRTDAFLAVGGFHPLVFFGGEETLLAQDLAAAGWGLAYVSDVVATHHPEPHADRSSRRRQQSCNALLSALLRRPLSVPLRQAGAILRHSPHRDERAGVLDALRRLPAALAHRQVLPVHVERQVRLLEAAGG